MTKILKMNKMQKKAFGMNFSKEEITLTCLMQLHCGMHTNKCVEHINILYMQWQVGLVDKPNQTRSGKGFERGQLKRSNWEEKKMMCKNEKCCEIDFKQIWYREILKWSCLC